MMASLWRPGQPNYHDVCVDDKHRFAMWDAAYVLGCLTPCDRREFEVHIAHCSACWEATAELSGMPAMLSQLDPSELAAINEFGDLFDIPKISAQLLPSVLATVRQQRRRSRLITCAAAAAAALLAISVFVGFHGNFTTSPPSHTFVPALQMTQVGTKLLTATVWVTSERWGTSINMRSACLAPLDAPHDRLAMVVIGRDGSQTRLATWVAEPGHTATPDGSIWTPANQIAAVQVVYASNVQLLLERSL